MTLLGTGLADLLRLEAQATPVRVARRSAKAIPFIFQSGGPSQRETWDPKPDAPAEIRGEYGTTQTCDARNEAGFLGRRGDKWDLWYSEPNGAC
jgi:hypothetical protein